MRRVPWGKFKKFYVAGNNNFIIGYIQYFIGSRIFRVSKKYSRRSVVLELGSKCFRYEIKYLATEDSDIIVVNLSFC